MPTPRAVLDTNLYLNYFLSPDPVGTTVDLVLDAASRGVIDLILPADVIHELVEVTARRPYLRSRITPDDVNALLSRVLEFAALAPEFKGEPPPISRDEDDDFLIAVSIFHAADFLVTRDRDLLSLAEVAGVQIVDPVTLLRMLGINLDRD